VANAPAADGHEQLIEMPSSSQLPPLRTVRAVPAHCWVPSRCTEVVLSATVTLSDPAPLTSRAWWNVIERTALIWFWNAA
jgi:hypothetical protein